jgi:aminomethyltransferase
MVPFGGWEMPLAYPTGTVAEHLACRTQAVAFDVSHLGTVRVEADGLERLQAAFTNDLERVAPGRAQYTHLLDDDGSVLDDIIVWWRPDGTFDVMPNASNTSRVLDAIGGHDVTGERAVIAVQGPTARERLGAIHSLFVELPRFAVSAFTWHGVDCIVAATGYTGEDGIEVAVPAESAAALWDTIVGCGVVPAGLGARDTLRLEAGLPLHGHELGPGITPLQAGLGWVVAWDKGDFRGRAALDRERTAGVARRLRGIEVDGRQPPRDGYSVLVEGKPAGTVTSGNYSPVLERGIGLAFLPPEVEVGADVEVDVRGRPMPARVVKLPFVSKKKG